MDTSNSTGFSNLAPEMKKEILKWCSTNALLTCRSVTHQLRDFAEEILSKRARFWMKKFENFQEFSVSITGTRLSSVEDIERFTLEMESSGGITIFPNKTVIFNPSLTLDEADKKQFYREFGLFVNKFGSYIKRLAYAFTNFEETEIDCFSQLEAICKLSNLESLAVCQIVRKGVEPFSDVADLIEKLENRMKEKKFVQNLQELVIFPVSGCDSGQSRKPFATIFINLKPFMNSVTHFQFCLNIPSHFPFHTPLNQLDPHSKSKLICPKLQAIKIFRPTPEVLMFYCQPRPTNAFSLKQIHLGIDDELMEFAGGNIIQFLFDQLECHARSLETLYLSVDDDKQLCELRGTPALKSKEWPDLAPFNFKNKYYRLKSFSVFVAGLNLKLNVILEDDFYNFINLERLAELSKQLFQVSVWFRKKLQKFLLNGPLLFFYFDIRTDLLEDVFVKVVGNYRRRASIKQIMFIPFNDYNQFLYCVPETPYVTFT